MTLLDRVVAVVTSIVSVVTFSPFADNVDNQIALKLPLSVSPVQYESSEPVIQHGESGVSVIQENPFPIFQPPGTPDKKNPFKCVYPAMTGWEDCSHELDRKCWLRRKSDGKQFDINSDYENEWPVGIDRYVWLDLADGTWDADGKPFTEAKLFNNSYPGPWIQACWGDRLIVNVTNSLDHNGTSVHWHGIRQLNSTHMDGVNGVTQCPIAPGDSFVYNFTLTQYGSSWYHSHYSVQYADGAAGPLTIHGPSSGDWDEAASSPLIMTDWYHNSAFKVLTTNDNGGKDILLNGRGNITKFNNELEANTTVKPAYSINFEQPRRGEGCKKYLLRVINTSFDTTFVFSIDNHYLTVVSADFVPIQPYRNTSILVGIGQRYNVVVEANPLDIESPLADDGNYWIRTQIAKCFGGSDEGSPGYDEVGILRYDSSSKADPTTKKWRGISTKCSDETYNSLNPILPWTVKPPSNGNKNYGEAFETYFIGKERDEFPLANFTLDYAHKNTPLRVDYSDPIFLHMEPEPKPRLWPDLWRVQEETFGSEEWIYLALIAPSNKASALAHPIHLHGHDFAILQQVEHTPFCQDNLKLKLRNPPRRDVVLLPTNGFVVIAFKADNPGPWLVHCHIAAHASLGLGMQILENQGLAAKMWPKSSEAVKEVERVCSNWNIWHDKMSNWANPPKAAGGNCTEEEWEFCFQDDSGV